MGTLVTVAVIFVLLVVLIAGLIIASHSTESESPTEVSPSEEGYRLVHLQGDYGEGYAVERVSDGQRLRWQTLPRSKGLEAIGVAGESHYLEDLQSPTFAPGSRLSLVREPDNPYDENAVAIMDAHEKHQAGYIPGDEAPRIASKLERGEDLQCVSMWEVVKDGQRVSLRVLLVGEEASVDVP